LSVHLRHNYKRMQHNIGIDWNERLSVFKYDHIVHLAIFPYADEPYEIIAESLHALHRSTFDPKRIAVVLASEARGGRAQRAHAERLKSEFEHFFLAFLITEHPDGLPGDIPGKGSNISYAAEEARRLVLDVHGIAYEHVIVSAFDVDTVVYPQYFSC